MTSPIEGRSFLDIEASVKMHREVILDLLAAHELTGCDTVASPHGIGKMTALKVLRTQSYRLDQLGLIQKIWTQKNAQRKNSTPQLSSLPPTDEAFRQNNLRAQLQVAIWLHALDPHPPDLDVTLHGWSQREGTDSLYPVTVPDGIALIPEELVHLIKCSCQAERPCRTQRCSCRNASLQCSSFCACKGEAPCYNINVSSMIATPEFD